MKIIANKIGIEVEDSGAAREGQGRSRPVVLLIMGLGMQLTAWPPALVQALVDAGYRVVRFDNRDVGLSQRFDALGKPKILWAGLRYRLGWRIAPPYRLHDMAWDALGVLDALQIDKAHVVGASMGGMIAQRLALLAPNRLTSLTSLMSSSGARGLPGPNAEVTRILISGPAGSSIEAAIEHFVRVFKAIGSPAYPMAEADLRDLVGLATRRSLSPIGTFRQMVAIMADSSRADELAGVQVPTLVVHGKADPLLPFACAEDTARRIPGARLHSIDGMGHDLPPGVVERLVSLLLAHFAATMANNLLKTAP